MSSLITNGTLIRKNTNRSQSLHWFVKHEFRTNTETIYKTLELAKFQKIKDYSETTI